MKHAIGFAIVLLINQSALPADKPLSHPPMRVAPPPSNRPLAPGKGYYVDAVKGDDRNDGVAAKPWKTINHALTKLKAGDTLYLKGGVYYENVYLALRGKPEAPITIRSAPGEQAIIDGGIREFFENPADAWEPEPMGGPGEYCSKKSYANLRDVIGSFGDSMIGLQTYYYAKDLRATNELIDWEDWKDQQKTDLKPLYCGPGLWYDPDTGRIQMRLAHTHLPEPLPNYRGEIDPRKLPLVLAAFDAKAMHMDGAQYVRLQDLIVRGGGYTTVVLDHVKDIEFDNVTVWCGAYGMRFARVVGFKFLNSALHGNAAPWTFRTDTSKRDYPGRPHRNITRLNTHSLIELDGGRESSIFATPYNDHWEFAYSEFTDAHDALYLGGIHCKFHHNLIENMQDDGIYLSPMYYRHRLDKNDPEIHIYQNVFRQVLTGLAFGGPEPETRDKVFIYRNLFDLRASVATGRPSTQQPEARFSTGKVIGDHGSPPWSAMNIYHNTFAVLEPCRDVAMHTAGSTKAGLPRRVFNNIYLHYDRLPGYVPPLSANGAVEDGNLFWSVKGEPKGYETSLKKYRASTEYEASKKLYAPGSSTNSKLADPKFLKAAADAKLNDYRLGDGSPAIDAGVPIPEEWPDPVRKLDKDKPDIGALPVGVEMWGVGRGKK